MINVKNYIQMMGRGEEKEPILLLRFFDMTLNTYGHSNSWMAISDAHQGLWNVQERVLGHGELGCES